MGAFCFCMKFPEDVALFPSRLSSGREGEGRRCSLPNGPGFLPDGHVISNESGIRGKRRVLTPESTSNLISWASSGC